LYKKFVDGFVELTRKYALGDPTEAGTTLGPLVRTAAADGVRAQIEASIAAGASGAIVEQGFAKSAAGTPYLAPQVLLDVNHRMPVMREEIFGPVAGIMKVSSDDEAVDLMNDSDFGLTAAIWTEDADAALALGQRVNTGTWFQNRCDYLDPALAWVGVKDSGRGCTLSVVGFEHLTRPKSFHMRLKT
jgi:acyl-CoA reductase-like NAD-dependent aldehyde dehydrogenase